MPTTVDWAAVQRDYAAGKRTVTEICASHGVSKTSLYRQAREHGWLLRAASAPPSPKPKTKKGANARQDDLAGRLLTLLDRKMTEFENRMAEGATTPADSERDARTLNALMRLFEKLKKPHGKQTSRAAASPPGAADTSYKDAHDADRLRNDLAQRLERLRGQLGG